MAFETVGVKVTLEGVAAFERGMSRVERSMFRTGRQVMTTEERAKVFNKTLTRMGIALTAAGGAAVAFLFSATRLAARVQTLGVVTVTLGRNIGKTEEEIRELEQAVKDQGITLRGARRAIALMIQSQIDLSKATKLARLAQNAAVIANINSTEAFERLVFVITSGNVRMARTLGLQVSFQSAYKKTAEELGKNTLELTVLEKVQARTNAVLETGTTIAGAYADAMETAGKKVLSLDRHIEDSKVILGEAWLPIYAEAVDFVTKSLVTWQELGDVQQATTSRTLGFVAAATALVGITFLAIPQIIAFAGAFSTLATAIFGVGGFVFGATALLGFLVVGIGAAVIAIVALVNAFLKWRAMGEKINDLLEEQIATLIDAEVSQEEYEKEIQRLADVSNRAVISLDEYNQLIARGGLFARAAEKSVVLLTESQREMAIRTERTNIVLGKQTVNLEKLVEAEETAEEKTKRLVAVQKILADQFRALKQLASVDLTQAFEDYQGKVEDLNVTIETLESRSYLTKRQKEELADAREELEKTNQAWKKNTAVVIANLFEQAIALGDVTEEEIFAFAKLQERLGLVDKGYAALTEAVFAQAAQLNKSGDQIDETVGDMEELFLSMLDPTQQAKNLAAAINSIKGKTVTITAKFIREGLQTQLQGGGGFTPPGTTTTTTTKITTPRGLQEFQAGGFAQRGRAHLVGERGPEIFAPGMSGMVLPNAFVKAVSTVTALLRGMAPALAGAPVTNVAGSSQMTNNFNMTVNTQAPVEPIIGDFRSMQALANAV